MVVAVDSAPNALRQLVVVGRGLIGATAAITLAKFLAPSGCKVTWLIPQALHECDDQDVEMADPALSRWLAMVGCPERELIDACHGLYSLGVEYQSEKDDFFFPYGTHGITPSPAPLEHEFFKCFNGAEQASFTQCFLATRAAKKGRFDFPVDDPRSVKSTLRYGLHLDRAALVDYLQKFAGSLAVQCVSCDTLQVEGNEKEGIASLVLEDGTRIAGDFYVDATGARAQLLREALATPFRVGSDSLWRYRLSYREPQSSPWRPYARMTRERYGWRREAGLQNATGVTAWLQSPSELNALEQQLKECGTRYWVQPLETGRCSEAWRSNCLALGQAAAQPGELLLSEWFWASHCLLLWLELLPDRANQPRIRAEYNRRWETAYERLIELHWLHAGRAECDKAELPEALQWRLNVLRSFGRLWRRDDELMTDESWVALALGLGWHAEGYDPTLADIGVEPLMDKHRKILQALDKVAEKMPSLSAVIKRH